ncbi:MAG: transcription elongation factor GreB [Gammaproteobacteria bacterium]|nr:transcription elongation factor GreB [Gammaproteobacteria bacterium]MDP2141948.1 transcription elongation factor GreB [Gammaproteobacteria bacterium]MDP2347170.1 transcription elongation factor GreB [Gammaproteobacteria bacterium]
MHEEKKPLPKVSNYITVEGEKRLRDELNYLWRVERPIVTQQVSDAAALGDRSENAEYIYGKKRLREIDRRVRHLRKRLEVLTIVDKSPSDLSRIYFGAHVRVEDDAGTEHDYRLVGPDEIGEGPGYISVDAPLGRALLGKQAGNEVDITTPGGKRSWYVLDIKYEGAE